MTWTYTNNPSGVPLDELRLMIGDVLADDPQLTDEELSHLLSSAGSVPAAAMQAAQTLRALFARMVDQSVGDLKYSYSQRHAQYSDLIVSLKAKQATRSLMPIAGGISVTEKGIVSGDTDRVVPHFQRGQFDNDSAG